MKVTRAAEGLYRVRDKVWDIRFYIAFTTEAVEEFESWIPGGVPVTYRPKKRGDRGCFAKYPTDSGTYLMVYIGRDATPGTVAHEALHFTVDALTHKGMTLTDASEEAYAYMIGGIVNAIRRAARKHEKSVGLFFQKLN